MVRQYNRRPIQVRLGPAAQVANIAGGVSEFLSQRNNMARYRTPQSQGRRSIALQPYRTPQTMSRAVHVARVNAQIPYRPRQLFQSELAQQNMKVSANPSNSGSSFKKGKKLIKSKIAGNAKNGTTSVFETSYVASDDYCAVVGHVTHAENPVWKAIARSLIKHMAHKLNKSIESFQESDNDWVTGDFWSLAYKNAGNDASMTVTTFYTHPATPSVEWNVIADALYALMTTQGPQIEFIQMRFVPFGNVGLATRFDLREVYCTVKAKSSMKIQNQSIPSAGATDSELVTNIPLIGRNFKGKGNGTSRISMNSIYLTNPQYYATNDGIILGGASATSSVKEPFKGHELVNVAKVSNVHLEPGQTKTDYLTHTFSGNINYIQNVIGTTAGATKFKTAPGKYSLFMIERQLQTGTPAAATGPIVALEINLEVNCWLTVKATRKTNIVYTYTGL